MNECFHSFACYLGQLSGLWLVMCRGKNVQASWLVQCHVGSNDLINSTSENFGSDNLNCGPSVKPLKEPESRLHIIALSNFTPKPSPHPPDKTLPYAV